MPHSHPLNVELRCLSRKMLRALFSTARHREIERTVGTNGWILAYIGDQSDRDVFQKDLEKEFAITRSAASKNVDALVRGELLARESVPYDARLKKLVLQKRGEEILTLMRKNNAELEQKLTSGFSQRELSELRGYLERLSKNLETALEETSC